MNDTIIQEIDKSLEIAELIRASESGYARDFRSGSAFGQEADRRRLDAFTLGVLDALAKRIGSRQDWLGILVYQHKLLELGPGERTRSAYREMCELASKIEFARYVGGGRYHALRVLSGIEPDVGRFARLMSEELAGF